ncbi:MAG: hypothetical protein ACI9ON_002249 [Limisphaerales bacterium]|jgi:hypothetical protein
MSSTVPLLIRQVMKLIENSRRELGILKVIIVNSSKVVHLSSHPIRRAPHILLAVTSKIKQNIIAAFDKNL